VRSEESLDALRVDLLLRERRAHEPGTDRRREDAEVGALEREHLDEADEAVLRGHIRGLVRRGDEPVSGSDGYEAPVSGRGERLPRVLREQKRACQQHRDERVPPLLGKVRDRRDVLEPGVRDDRVEPAITLERRIDDRAVPLMRGQIAVREVDCVHGPAVALEPLDHRTADPAGRAGDEGRLHPQRMTVAAHV
jgi:hypothetical protein